ncbi:gag-pol [Trichonephila clavipes]|nr:gag-pol [Trichonephila clavipes]
MQALIAEHQNQKRRSITCWGCGESGHLRSNCPRNNKKDRSTKCWGCGGAGHLRNNCPRVNQKDPHRTNGIESKKVCSHQKGSADGNIEAPSRRPCTENSKYSWRIEKKFDVMYPVVRQVTTPSTSESDPWSDEGVRKDQWTDPEIKQS